jgi:acetyl-CoA carboxylase biotin carboxyl carrier protein
VLLDVAMDMDLARIKSLIETMAASDLTEMQVNEGEWSLRLVRRGQGAAALVQSPQAAPARSRRAVTSSRASPPAPGASQVVAPLFGMVYLRPSPEAPYFVTPGQPVMAGTTLCIIEAMKVLHQVHAPRDGTIASVLVTCGQEVEAGQELMRYE